MRILIKLALVTTAPKIKSLFVEHFVLRKLLKWVHCCEFPVRLKWREKKVIHQFEWGCSKDTTNFHAKLQKGLTKLSLTFHSKTAVRTIVFEHLVKITLLYNVFVYEYNSITWHSWMCIICAVLFVIQLRWSTWSVVTWMWNPIHWRPML